MSLYKPKNLNTHCASAHPEIVDFNSLKLALAAKADAVNLSLKCKDVEHLLFRHDRAEMVLHFADFVSVMNG